MVDVFKIVFGRRKVVADMDPPAQRLSETNEIQLAFQQEMARIFNEAGAGTTPPIPPIQIPMKVEGRIDGQRFAKSIDEMEAKGTLQTLGFKPEHVRVFKSLAYLLDQCSRLSATEQNLKICEPLFHPTHPITPTVADAGEEVIASVVACIEPANK